MLEIHESIFAFAWHFEIVCVCVYRSVFLLDLDIITNLDRLALRTD